MDKKQKTFKFDVLWATFIFFFVVGIISMIISFSKPFLMNFESSFFYNSFFYQYSDKIYQFYIDHLFTHRVVGILGLSISLLVLVSKLIIDSQSKKHQNYI